MFGIFRRRKPQSTKTEGQPSIFEHLVSRFIAAGLISAPGQLTQRNKHNHLLFTYGYIPGALWGVAKILASKDAAASIGEKELREQTFREWCGLLTALLGDEMGNSIMTFRGVSLLMPIEMMRMNPDFSEFMAGVADGEKQARMVLSGHADGELPIDKHLRRLRK